ncbi:hypothetical protein ACQKQD_19005 [Methylobacterium sp. NPDC080182]|uniref:hypothetical protein n=1 Tax=Methylobacterium sp. NPDC080182 TaxID=3390590 RepID=UPI003D038B93
MTPQEQFQAFAPDAPLPWQEHPHRKGLIVDANGEDVCWIDGSDPGWRGIAAMVVVAVNTCGGFKAEPITPHATRTEEA